MTKDDRKARLDGRAERTRWWRLLLTSLLAGTLLIGGVGCRAKRVDTELPEDPAKLRAVVMLYGRAAQRLRRPPKSRDELLAAIESGGDVEGFLKSSRDGEFFAVVWGLDITGRDRRYAGPIAYERQGMDGKRFYVTADRVVHEAGDIEFRQLPFPRGHKPE